MSPTRLKRAINLGSPACRVTLHFTLRGFSSWSVKLGRWSWNSRSRRPRVDLPGPVYWVGRRRPNRDRDREEQP